MAERETFEKLDEIIKAEYIYRTGLTPKGYISYWKNGQRQITPDQQKRLKGDLERTVFAIENLIKKL